MPGKRYSHQITAGPYERTDCRILKQHARDAQLFIVELRPRFKGAKRIHITVANTAVVPKPKETHRKRGRR